MEEQQAEYYSIDLEENRDWKDFLEGGLEALPPYMTLEDEGQRLRISRGIFRASQYRIAACILELPALGAVRDILFDDCTFFGRSHPRLVQISAEGDSLIRFKSCQFHKANLSLRNVRLDFREIREYSNISLSGKVELLHTEEQAFPALELKQCSFLSARQELSGLQVHALTLDEVWCPEEGFVLNSCKVVILKVLNLPETEAGTKIDLRDCTLGKEQRPSNQPSFLVQQAPHLRLSLSNCTLHNIMQLQGALGGKLSFENTQAAGLSLANSAFRSRNLEIEGLEVKRFGLQVAQSAGALLFTGATFPEGLTINNQQHLALELRDCSLPKGMTVANPLQGLLMENCEVAGTLNCYGLRGIEKGMRLQACQIDDLALSCQAHQTTGGFELSDCTVREKGTLYRLGGDLSITDCRFEKDLEITEVQCEALTFKKNVIQTCIIHNPRTVKTVTFTGNTFNQLFIAGLNDAKISMQGDEVMDVLGIQGKEQEWAIQLKALGAFEANAATLRVDSVHKLTVQEGLVEELSLTSMAVDAELSIKVPELNTLLVQGGNYKKLKIRAGQVHENAHFISPEIREELHCVGEHWNELVIGEEYKTQRASNFTQTILEIDAIGAFKGFNSVFQKLQIQHAAIADFFMQDTVFEELVLSDTALNKGLVKNCKVEGEAAENEEVRGILIYQARQETSLRVEQSSFPRLSLQEGAVQHLEVAAQSRIGSLYIQHTVVQELVCMNSTIRFFWVENREGTENIKRAKFVENELESVMMTKVKLFGCEVILEEGSTILNRPQVPKGLTFLNNTQTKSWHFSECSGDITFVEKNKIDSPQQVSSKAPNVEVFYHKDGNLKINGAELAEVLVQDSALSKIEVPYPQPYYKPSKIERFEILETKVSHCIIGKNTVFKRQLNHLHGEPLQLGKIYLKIKDCEKLSLLSCVASELTVENSLVKAFHLQEAAIKQVRITNEEKEEGNTDREDFGQISLEDSKLPDIDIENIGAGTLCISKCTELKKLSLHNLELNDLRLQDFNPEAIEGFRVEMRFINRSNQKAQQLCFEDSDLSGFRFRSCYFSTFQEMQVRNCTFDAIKCASTTWPSQVVSLDKDKKHDYYEVREACRQFKLAMDAHHDRVSHLQFHALEMNAYCMTLKWRWRTISDKLSLLAARTNSFGLKWQWPLLWLLFGVPVLTYLMYWQHCGGWPYFELDDSMDWSTAFILLNPTHQISHLNMGPNPVSGVVVIDFIARIYIAFFIYQGVAAFRKFRR